MKVNSIERFPQSAPVCHHLERHCPVALIFEKDAFFLVFCGRRASDYASAQAATSSLKFQSTMVCTYSL